MGSNLACVGLAIADSQELGDLVERASATAHSVGTFDGVRVMRWQDPSGAALILGWQAGGLADLLPTFASTAGGTVVNCRLVNDSVAHAALVDADGVMVTVMAFEPEQYRRIKALGRSVSGPARITALGVSVKVHADSDTFRASPDSLVDPSGDPTRQPPPQVAERGWPWPPRMASESFIPYIPHSDLGDPVEGTAHGRLSGVVIKASHRTCALTGQGFSVATVRSFGFEADVCLSDAEHPITPQPGNIISGTVFLAAAIEADGLVHRRGRFQSILRRGKAT